MAAHGLLRRIAEEALGRRVPALNHAVERLADDGVVRGFDDRREQPGRRQLAGVVPIHAPSCRDVAEDEHASGHLALVVPDRGGAVVDGALGAASLNQQRVIRHADDGAFAQGSRGRAFHCLVGGFVHDPEDGVERKATGLLLAPAGQGFGHRVEKGHAPLDIGRDDGVADAPKRDPQQLALLAGPELRQAGGVTEADDERAREKVRRQPDSVAGALEAKRAARRDEEIRARHVSEEGGDSRRERAAEPYGYRHGSEQRHERQRVAHQRVEQPAGEHGDAKRGHGQGVDDCRASPLSFREVHSSGLTIQTLSPANGGHDAGPRPPSGALLVD